MIRRWFVIVASMSLCAGAPGCGNTPGYYTVQGKVFYKGWPAAGAVVYFHPEGSAPCGADDSVRHRRG